MIDYQSIHGLCEWVCCGRPAVSPGLALKFCVCF